MLGTGEHSGIISLLTGVVLVVLCGIGISLVADTRLNLGDSEASIIDATKRDRDKLQSLNTAIEFAKNSWEQDHRPLIGQDDEIEKLKSQTRNNLENLAELRVRRASLQQDIATTSKDAQHYRVRYRTQTRADSVGESIETLATNDGRTYTDVSIRGFDDAGIRIHHQGGSARIRYSDLPTEMKERFHWQPNEEKLTKVAAATSKRPTERPTGKDLNDEVEDDHLDKPHRRKERPEANNSNDPDAAAISSARLTFIQARQVYYEAKSQESIALSNSNNSKKSVPGSLETWPERAERMSRLSQRLYADYLKARSRLALLSPKDPLLRIPIR